MTNTLKNSLGSLRESTWVQGEDWCRWGGQGSVSEEVIVEVGNATLVGDREEPSRMCKQPVQAPVGRTGLGVPERRRWRQEHTGGGMRAEVSGEERGKGQRMRKGVHSRKLLQNQTPLKSPKVEASTVGGLFAP